MHIGSLKPTMKRVALYARISTDDGRQDTRNQVLEIEQMCAQRHWTIVSRYTEEKSGMLGPQDRPELGRLLLDAHRGMFDAVVVFALDRLTRQGIEMALHLVRRLTECSVEFHSVTEPQFSTVGAAGDLMIAISGWMAKQERDQHVKRIHAGLAKARSKGTHLGRNPRVVDMDRLVYLIEEEGMSINKAQHVLGISRATISRRMFRYRQEQKMQEQKATGKVVEIKSA